MSFVAKLQRAREVLEQQDRLSFRALGRELEVGGEELEEIVEELVDVQRVALREGRTLVWNGARVPTARDAGGREPRSYTPRHLAEKILQSRSALEGERKRVTVLFADIADSMALAERLGPEAWHRVLDRFFQILGEGVHRYEGTINQYTGDGIMALFGAPIAHEDHAQRACWAALDLLESVGGLAAELGGRHGVELGVRLGLNSGEVVVGKIGDDLRMDYTAQGQVVGLAQRMESLAEPGSCWLSGAAAELVEGYFELADRGLQEVKGASEEVRVFELLGPGRHQTHFEVSRARGLTRFVGRDAEMRALEDALGQAQSGHGQVVGIVAAAGTGKSRLCYEFLERCRRQGVDVIEGRGVSHGRNLPFLPMLQIFRAYYGISDEDDDDTARLKIRDRLLPLELGIEEELPILFEFFGVSDPAHPVPALGAEAKQRRIFSVLRRVVQGADPRAGARYLVPVLEDLHWIDPASEAFLEEWVEAIAGSSSFLLVNFRPEYRAAWMQKSYYRQIPLQPLGPEAMRELLEELLGNDPSVAGLAEAISERTGGNPFFSEEVVRSLVESERLVGERCSYRLRSPIERLEVPATVQSVLAARIDRLVEGDKEVLQAASVIGRELGEGILAESVDLSRDALRESLRRLERGEFLYRTSPYPSTVYAFQHPLTQEVALASQLSERRRQTHGRVAKAIEQQREEDLDEAAALVAHHWDEAGVADQAAVWHRRAAEWAGVSDVGAALRHWRRVRQLAPTIDDVVEGSEHGLVACSQILALGWRTGAGEDELTRTFEDGRQIAEAAGDRHALARLVGNYSVIRGVNAGSAGDYVRYSREAVEIAEELGDRELLCGLGTYRAFAHWFTGEPRECLKHCEELLARVGDDPVIGAEVTGYSPLATVRGFGGAMVKSYLGRFDEALGDAVQVLELSRREGLIEGESWSHLAIAHVTATRGAAQGARHHAERSLELGERFSHLHNRILARAVLGQILTLEGDQRAATVQLEGALTLTQQHRYLFNVPFIESRLAEARLQAGDLPDARRHAEAGVERARQSGAPGWEGDALLSLALVLARSGEGAALDRGGKALAGAERLIHQTEFLCLVPRIEEVRGRLARARGDEAACRRYLEEAERLYREIDADGHAERLRRGIGG